MDIEETNLVKMTFKHKGNIKPLDPKPWLRQQLINLERVGTLSYFTSYFTSPIIILPKKKDPYTYKVS